MIVASLINKLSLIT